MPYQEPDETDPLTLHGMVIEADSDQPLRDMAECFIDEYIRLGFDADRLLKMFQTQGYAGPYLAWQTLGEETIVAMIDEHVQRWGPRLPTLTMEHNADGDVMLPVLDQ